MCHGKRFFFAGGVGVFLGTGESYDEYVTRIFAESEEIFDVRSHPGPREQQPGGYLRPGTGSSQGSARLPTVGSYGVSGPAFVPGFAQSPARAGSNRAGYP